MNINLHIERLVLSGISITADQQHLLQASLITELTRMLTIGGLSPSLAAGNAIPRTATGKIPLNEDNTPTILGRVIAQSLYGGGDHE